jgi:hypothetical protein
MAPRKPSPAARALAGKNRAGENETLRELGNSLTALSLGLSRLERLAAELSLPAGRTRRRAA